MAGQISITMLSVLSLAIMKFAQFYVFRYGGLRSSIINLMIIFETNYSA